MKDILDRLRADADRWQNCERGTTATLAADEIEHLRRELNAAVDALRAHLASRCAACKAYDP